MIILKEIGVREDSRSIRILIIFNFANLCLNPDNLYSLLIEATKISLYDSHKYLNPKILLYSLKIILIFCLIK